MRQEMMGFWDAVASAGPIWFLKPPLTNTDATPSVMFNQPCFPQFHQTFLSGVTIILALQIGDQPKSAANEILICCNIIKLTYLYVFTLRISNARSSQ